MARITVEDCNKKINNKFALVLMSAKRAKDIARGGTPSVSKDNDKPEVIALREIAEETISLEGLETITKRSLIEDKESLINMAFQDFESNVLDESLDIHEEEEDEEENLDAEDLLALRDLDLALGDDESTSSYEEE